MPVVGNAECAWGEFIIAYYSIFVGLTVLIFQLDQHCPLQTVMTTRSHGVYRADPIWFDETHCVGSETSLADCVHNAYGEHDCDHSADVTVRCAVGNSSGGGLKTRSWG